MMGNIYYVIYALLLGILAVYTGEIVTFIMLGLILMSLENIHRTIKKNVSEDESGNGTDIKQNS